MNRIKVDKRGFQIGYYCNCSHSNLTEYIPVKARHGRCIYCKHYAVYGNKRYIPECERIKRGENQEDLNVHFQEYNLSDLITIGG